MFSSEWIGIGEEKEGEGVGEGMYVFAVLTSFVRLFVRFSVHSFG